MLLTLQMKNGNRGESDLPEAVWTKRQRPTVNLGSTTWCELNTDGGLRCTKSFTYAPYCKPPKQVPFDRKGN